MQSRLLDRTEGWENDGGHLVGIIDNIGWFQLNQLVGCSLVTKKIITN